MQTTISQSFIWIRKKKKLKADYGKNNIIEQQPYEEKNTQNPSEYIDMFSLE